MTGSVGPENEPAWRQQAARRAPSCGIEVAWTVTGEGFNGRERHSPATVNSSSVVLRFLHGHARTRQLAAQLVRLHCRRLLPFLERGDVGRLRESRCPAAIRSGGIEGVRHRQRRTEIRSSRIRETVTLSPPSVPMIDYSSADLWIVPLGTKCFVTCISAPISDDRATPAIIGTAVEALSIASL
jgi:hypothetical protein